MVNKHLDDKEACPAAAHQEKVQRAKLEQPKGAIRLFLRRNPSRAETVRNIFNASSTHRAGAAKVAIRAADMLAEEAVQIARDLYKVRNQKYWAYQDDQLRQGAGGLHAKAKGSQLCPVKPVTTAEGHQSVHPVDVLEH